MNAQTLERPQSGVRPHNPYKVLLHNDNHHEFQYVTGSLHKAIPGISQPQAHAITLEAHEQGVAIVLACPLEHAEMYCERLQSFGLTSSIEEDV